MRDADAGRGLGHAIQIDIVRGRAPRAIGRADDQRFADRMAAILFEEGAKRRLAEARDEDRLVLPDQPHVEETPLAVEHHQQVDRRAGKPRKRCQALGFKDISGLAAAGIQQRPDALVVDRLAQLIGREDQGASSSRVSGAAKSGPESIRKRTSARHMARACRARRGLPIRPKSQVITSGPVRPVRARMPTISSVAAMIGASACCGSSARPSGPGA